MRPSAARSSRMAQQLARLMGRSSCILAAQRMPRLARVPAWSACLNGRCAGPSCRAPAAYESFSSRKRKPVMLPYRSCPQAASQRRTRRASGRRAAAAARAALPLHRCAGARRPGCRCAAAAPALHDVCRLHPSTSVLPDAGSAAGSCCQHCARQGRCSSCVRLETAHSLAAVTTPHSPQQQPR